MSTIKCFAVLLLLSCCSFAGHAQSVDTDRLLFEPDELIAGEDFAISFIYFGNVGGRTSFFLEETTIRADTFTLGPDSFWYLADEGEAFTLERILAGDFEKISFNPEDPEPPIVDLGALGDHYFGISSNPTGSFGDRGWVKIRLSEEEPVFLGGALTNDPRGIFIGSTQIVPEPTGVSGLMLVVLAMISFRRFEIPEQDHIRQ